MRVRHSGFTLIEILMVVAIVGILSSVAIPSFRKAQLRSRQAERSLMIVAIEKATDEYYARDNRYPEDLGGGDSQIVGGYNPAFPPVAQKRPFVENQPGWRDLSLKVEGNLLFSYLLSASAPATGKRTHVVWAYGDLDGDGNTQCYVFHVRRWDRAIFQGQESFDSSAVAGVNYDCL